MQFLIKRVDPNPKKCVEASYEYSTLKNAIDETKRTSERVFMYNHVCNRPIFEIWKKDKLVVSIQTDLVDFCSSTKVTKH